MIRCECCGRDSETTGGIQGVPTHCPICRAGVVAERTATLSADRPPATEGALVTAKSDGQTNQQPESLVPVLLRDVTRDDYGIRTRRIHRAYLKFVGFSVLIGALIGVLQGNLGDAPTFLAGGLCFGVFVGAWWTYLFAFWISHPYDVPTGAEILGERMAAGGRRTDGGGKMAASRSPSAVQSESIDRDLQSDNIERL